MRHDRVAVVTGASSGIGVPTAVGIARAGFDVVVVGRDPARLADTAKQVVATGREADARTVDFASLADVRRLADELVRDLPRIDVLVNNAGTAIQRGQTTADGYEMTFGVNHLAPYLLTRLLLDRIRASAPARVVVVSSDAYKGGSIDFDDLMMERNYKPLRAYGNSKLANALFAFELARRLEGSGVVANALHPGVVRTGLARDNKVANVVWRYVIGPFARSPEKGAQTSVYLATAQEAANVSGKFFQDSRPIDVQPKARDADVARRLWDVSAELVGLPAD